jgi:hypothetical protein
MRTLLLLGFFAIVAAAPSAAARHQSATLATLTGACTRLLIMDTATDPTLCSDNVISFKLRNGQIGFTFIVNRPDESKPVIVSFFGTRPRHFHHDQADLSLPIYKVYFTFNDGTDDLVALGSCAYSDPYRKIPAKVSCSANTIEGNFSGEFISNGVAPNVSRLQ